MRILVTRPQPEAQRWTDALCQAGFDALSLPLIAIAPAPDPAAVHAAWARIADFDAVMFVSANAVRQFFSLKPARTPIFSADAATKTRAFVTGPGSLAALRHTGVAAAWIDAPPADAPQFDSEALWAVVAAQVCPGFRLLIVRGADALAQSAGRDWLAEQARATGAVVEFVVAYQRQAPRLDAAALQLAQAAAADGSVWLFSSAEAIRNLALACPQQSWAQAQALVTHPHIGQTARDVGFAVVSESRPSLAAMMASLESMA